MVRRAAHQPRPEAVAKPSGSGEPVVLLTEEGALVARLRAGDEQAFEAIVREHAGALSAYAEYLTGSAEEAAEVVQDVLHGLWRVRVTLAISGTLRQYLYGATKNRSLNAMRRTRRDERLARSMTNELTVAAGIQLAPDESVQAMELDSAVRWAIDRLPEASRAAYALRWEGYSHAEIAERLGIAVRAVEMRIGRALAKLREQLADMV